VFPTIKHLEQLREFGSVEELLGYTRGRAVVPVERRWSWRARRCSASRATWHERRAEPGDGGRARRAAVGTVVAAGRAGANFARTATPRGGSPGGRSRPPSARSSGESVAFDRVAAIAAVLEPPWRRVVGPAEGYTAPSPSGRRQAARARERRPGRQAAVLAACEARRCGSRRRTRSWGSPRSTGARARTRRRRRSSSTRRRLTAAAAPARADVVVHSATNCIGGHPTCSSGSPARGGLTGSGAAPRAGHARRHAGCARRSWRCAGCTLGCGSTASHRGGALGRAGRTRPSAPSTPGFPPTPAAARRQADGRLRRDARVRDRGRRRRGRRGL
jgi:hypothetical protein